MGPTCELARWLSLSLAFLSIGGAVQAQASPLPARFARALFTEAALAQVGVEAARALGVDGRGATLCLVDTGVDVGMPEFRAPDGSPRARWFVDALVDPARVITLDEGSLDDAIDPHGHGTAMAAIVLGSGDGSAGAHDPDYTVGVAPAATLIVARAFDPTLDGFDDAAVVRAVRSCSQIAEMDEAIDAGRMAILLSLGGHDGAHDGRGAFERAIVEASAGAPVIVAAGNDGERAVHAAGRIVAGEIAEVEVRIPRPAHEAPWFGLSLAFDRADVAFALIDPDGVRSRADFIASGPREYRARVEPPALVSGTYTLAIEGPARFDVFLSATRLGPTFFSASVGGPYARLDEQVAIPATAPELIAVGATVSRAQFEGEPELGAAAGDIAPFSARGPTSRGVAKPDVVAPGGWIATSLSRQLVGHDPSNLLAGRPRPSARRIAVRGTSSAAAMVAGMLLLLMQDRALDATEARATLIAAADGSGWDPRAGWGEVHLDALLDASRIEPSARGPLELFATRAITPDESALSVTLRGVSREVIQLEVDGARTDHAVRWGRADLELDAPHASVGEPVHVIARSAEERADLFVDVVFDRSPNGAVRIGGGGCTACGRAPNAGFGLLTGLVLGARARRRRRRRSTETSAPDRRARRRRRFGGRGS